MSCKRHLSPDTRVVALARFENGIGNVQSRREDEMTAAELTAIHTFLLTEDATCISDASDEAEISFADLVRIATDVPTSSTVTSTWIISLRRLMALNGCSPKLD
ncbi:hypothetical protein DVH05_026098 [Phytophthora capsici]|nr:hypothetical protein DVH05_026098 [Phytophthora capsici]